MGTRRCNNTIHCLAIWTSTINFACQPDPTEARSHWNSQYYKTFCCHLNHLFALGTIAKLRRNPAKRTKQVLLETPALPRTAGKEVCSSGSILRPVCTQKTVWSIKCHICDPPPPPKKVQKKVHFTGLLVVYCTMFVFVSHRPLSLVIVFLYSFVIVSFYVHSYWSAEFYLSVLFLSVFSCPLVVPSVSLCPCPCQCLGSACSI